MWALYDNTLRLHTTRPKCSPRCCCCCCCCQICDLPAKLQSLLEATRPGTNLAQAVEVDNVQLLVDPSQDTAPAIDNGGR
jgi:hypothetical protein